MGGEGFEPSKRKVTDLQSAPFDHLGILPGWTGKTHPETKLKADIRTRTENLLITSQLLCQLSHIGTYHNKIHYTILSPRLQAQI